MSNYLGNRIKKIRLSRGMTMEKFGEELNTSKGTVNNWEKGRNKPNKENLKKIAELGGLSVDELLHGKLINLIRKKVDEVIENSTMEYSAEELRKIRKNKNEIINKNKIIFEYSIQFDDEKKMYDTINSSIRSFLHENKDINEKLLSETLYHLDDLRGGLHLHAVKDYVSNRDKLERNFYKGVYVYESVEVLENGVDEKIYEQIDTTLKNAFKSIQAIYKSNFDVELKESEWIELRNSILDSLSDEYFRRYSYYVTEMVSINDYSNRIDAILNTMIPELENRKYSIEANELKDMLISFLDSLEIPTDWEVAIEDLDEKY